MAAEIGVHWTEHIGPLSVHMDTLVTMWIVMGILVVLAFLSTRKLSIIPGKIQSVAEAIINYILDFTKSMGPEGKQHVPLLGTLFLFIISANLIGQIPFKLYHLEQGEMASPTNDINMTAAMAIIVVIYYIISGIRKKGLKYFKHYTQPIWFMTPFNIIEDIVRPLSLSIRLFANIFAGEMLIMAFGSLIAYFLPLPIMFFEIFVAWIQALIFTLLSAAYISIATQESH